MTTDLATFIVAALLTLGIGAFVVVCGVAAWRHFRWKTRARRRIGWYT